MPVENEDKYVLGMGRADALRDALGALGPASLIHQFYLLPQVRYRRTEVLGGGTSFEFTFKQLIQGRLLEENFDVTEESFRLAQLAAVGVIDKVRYKMPDAHPGAAWDIDFLLDAPASLGGRSIFAMAECEFPEGGSHGMPDILAPHVELAVPREDAHLFSNARLSTPGYADGLLERYRAGWRG